MQYPHCTDDVVARLESMAENDDAAKSDLAAAYYVRAQRNRNAVDYLRALDAAEQAAEANPRSADAQFNLALAQQANSLNEEAIASLDRFRALEPDDSPWEEEALARRNALERLLQVDAVTQWPIVKAKLRAAALRGDRTVVRKLIEPYTWLAQKFVEDELLVDWAERGSRDSLNAARVIAVEVSWIGRDEYPNDVIRAIDRATPTQLEALRRGHVDLADARALDR